MTAVAVVLQPLLSRTVSVYVPADNPIAESEVSVRDDDPLLRGHVRRQSTHNFVDLGQLSGLGVLPLRAPSLELSLDVSIATRQITETDGIDVDRVNPRACWIWMVADNLRLTAENAVAVAKEHA